MPIQLSVANHVPFLKAQTELLPDRVLQRIFRDGSYRGQLKNWASIQSPVRSGHPTRALQSNKVRHGPIRNIYDRLLIPLALGRVLTLMRMSGKVIDVAFPDLGIPRAGQTTLALFKAVAKSMLSVLPTSTKEKVVRRMKRGLRSFKTSLLPNDPKGDIIAVLPCIIRRPGRYRLIGDLTYAASTDAAIEVAANGVTIDLGGHALRNSAGPATCATGIGGSSVSDAVIVNGTVSGFRYGILLRAGKRYRVENIRMEENWQWGISVEGRDCVLRDNAIMNTGGSTAPCSKVCIAMRAFGARQTVEGNVITGLRRSAVNVEWVGIHFDSAPDSHLENNIIAATAREPLTWGIWLNGGGWGKAGGTDVHITRNRFINLHTAGTFADHAAGTCTDNLLINVTDRFIVSNPEVLVHNRDGNVDYLRVKVPDVNSSGVRAT
jgi:hypothetical protein